MARTHGGLRLGALGWTDSAWARQLGLVASALVLGAALGVGVVLAVNPVYVVAGLLGLGLATAMLVSAEIGLLSFVGVAALLPFAVVPVPLGTFKLTAVDVTLTVLLLVWMGRLLVKRDEGFRTTGLEALVALYVGLAAFSFLLSTGTTSETTRLFLKLVNSVLLFFSVVQCVRTRRDVERIVGGFVLAAGVSAGVGVVLYFLPTGTATRLLSSLAPLGYPSGGSVLRYIASTDTLRAIGTAIDPNIFGAMLMLAAVLGVSQILAPRPVLSRRVTYALTGVIFAALLLSYSRGSWMGALAGVLFMATLRYRRVWLLVALGAALLFLGAVPADWGFFGHLQSGFAAKDQAAAMRLGEYKDAFRLISQYPWFGVGFGVAPDVDLYIGVSSIYLLLAEQMGLVGLTSYLLVVGALIVRASRALFAGHSAPDVEPLLLGTTAALIAALTAGVFDHHFVNLRFPHVVALFWLLAGLTMVCVRLDASPKEEG